MQQLQAFRFLTQAQLFQPIIHLLAFRNHQINNSTSCPQKRTYVFRKESHCHCLCIFHRHQTVPVWSWRMISMLSCKYPFSSQVHFLNWVSSGFAFNLLHCNGVACIAFYLLNFLTEF